MVVVLLPLVPAAIQELLRGARGTHDSWNSFAAGAVAGSLVVGHFRGECAAPRCGPLLLVKKEVPARCGRSHCPWASPCTPWCFAHHSGHVDVLAKGASPGPVFAEESGVDAAALDRWW